MILHSRKLFLMFKPATHKTVKFLPSIVQYEIITGMNKCNKRRNLCFQNGTKEYWMKL